MPKRLLTASGFANAALLATALYVLALVALPTRVFVEVLNGLFLGMVVAVTVVFFPLFVRAISQRKFDRVAQLTIGIILTWLSLIISRSVNAMGKVLGNTEVLATSPMVTLAAYLAILGGVLHVTAPGMLDDRLRYNKSLLLFAGALGLTIALIMIYLQRNGLPW